MSPSQEKPRILYVEDDTDTCELVTYILTGANYEVISTGTCDQALRLAKSRQFDLYIVDNQLPDGSGLGLCDSLRAFDSDTPILFCSGSSTDVDKAAAEACGAQAYLTKPFEIEQLISEIRRLVSNSY